MAEHSGHYVEIDLAESVPKLIDEHPLITEDIQVDFTCPETPTIQVNRMFGKGIEELLTNALVHNDGETAELDISVRTPHGSRRMVEIVIADNGPGIPHWVIEVLHSSEFNQMTHLQGMGLWFVRWAVTESGGKIWFEDTAEGGTSIRIRVPTGSIRRPKKWGNSTAT